METITNLSDLLKAFDAKEVGDLEEALCDISKSNEVSILYKLNTGHELVQSDDLDEVTDDTLVGFNLSCSADDQVVQEFVFPTTKSMIEDFIEHIDDHVSEMEAEDEEDEDEE